MSAIAAIWRFDGGPDVSRDCGRMLDAQSIYGAYKVDAWSGGSVAVGRRLAKLLPEDIHDQQPLIGAGGRYVLVADLRLDNREELIGALDIAVPDARSMCDADILMAAFERWGEACCERLVGDYAFVLWDAADRRLVLARDFLGSRPLHYHRGNDFVAVASMPKGLHALAEIPRAPDEERAAQFLLLMPESGTRSFFKGVERVEPGSIVSITANRTQVRRHWDWDRIKPSPAPSGDPTEGLRHHLDQAVRVRLRGVSDTVAAHLSAGLDSSAVATTAARLLGHSGGKVIAFTAAPREGYGPSSKAGIDDESLASARVAAMYGNMEHVVIRTGHLSPLDYLDRNFFLYDQPVLNICNNVWISAINDAARQRKSMVLLTGQVGNASLSYSGNEVFSELLAKMQWGKWARMVREARRNGGWTLRGAAVYSFAPWLPRRLWRLLLRVSQGHVFSIDQYSAINPARLSELGLPSHVRAYGFDFAFRPFKSGLAMRAQVLGGIDLGNYAKGTLGGWGLDMRDPTADRRLIEFCFSLPTEFFFRNGIARGLARTVLADRVPAEVLADRRRGRQAPDWHDGVSTALPQLQDEVSRLAKIAPAARALDTARMKRLIENWPEAGWNRPEVTAPYRLALLRGISTGHFLRRASGANA
jgi:asparagine synthase (glutamine-hydrolysing)